MDEQREANESLVLATLRAKDSADSAHEGRQLAEGSARVLEQQAVELRTARAALEVTLAEAARLNFELARAGEGEKDARAEAEAANLAKDEFLALLGHELRNPLAPIAAALHLLKLGSDPATREIDVIDRQVQHMTRLVDDLLDVSRITRGKVELLRTHVELSEVVAAAVEMTGPLVASRAHRLRVTVPARGLSIDGDRSRVAQVISNLLTNAARYTPPGGDIALSASRSGKFVEVVVKDSGIGIEPPMLSRIFEPFVQVGKSSERNEGGLGIGLALVRNLVTLHGGTVEALSEGRGTGTTIVVRLPALAITRPEASSVASTPSLAKALVRRHILLVDDNVDAAEMLADVLRMKGHDVVVAHDAADALALVDEIQVDTAILDIGLPGMDGYELAGQLRARTKIARLIALTGYGQDADRERARAAGFDAHLVKPVSVRDLVRTLAEDG